MIVNETPTALLIYKPRRDNAQFSTTVSPLDVLLFFTGFQNRSVKWMHHAVELLNTTVFYRTCQILTVISIGMVITLRTLQPEPNTYRNGPNRTPDTDRGSVCDERIRMDRRRASASIVDRRLAQSLEQETGKLYKLESVPAMK